MGAGTSSSDTKREECAVRVDKGQVEGMHGPIDYTAVVAVSYRGRLIDTGGQTMDDAVVYRCTVTTRIKEPNPRYHTRNDDPGSAHGPLYMGDTSHVRHFVHTKIATVAIVRSASDPCPRATNS